MNKSFLCTATVQNPDDPQEFQMKCSKLNCGSDAEFVIRIDLWPGELGEIPFHVYACLPHVRHVEVAQKNSRTHIRKLS